MSNKKIIGLDLHSGRSVACIMTTGKKIIKRVELETNEKNLIELAKSNGKDCEIIFEEGTLAGWAYQILLPYCKVVVVDPKENKWIFKADRKNDRIDSQKLAELYIGGFTKEIFHPVGEMSELRDMILFYNKITQNIVRFKNQLKAIFRSKGIATTVGVYEKKYKDFENKLTHQSSKIQANIIYTTIQRLEREKAKILKKLKEMTKNNATIKVLDKIPGIGFISAISYLGIVVTPFRFENKRKFWAYSGFGITESDSNGRSKPQHLSNNYNRILKNITNQAVNTIVNRSSKNKFKKKYVELIKNNIRLSSAKLTIARKLLSTILALWKSGEYYSEAYK